MKEMIKTIMYGIGNLYPNAMLISNILLAALGIFSIHKLLFRVVGLFWTRKFPPAKKQHKYAILVPARNEEAVIGNLLNSIKRQDYPEELVTVFVVADNCTDNTAKKARELGAVCYERFDDTKRTKGFALQFLFEQIKRDYGIESFEGYFIFDSDNLLNSDYITRMNESFDAGEKIITSYRNTKNFDENWVASTYAIHWLRSIRFRHRARSVFRLATNIQGTGFLIASELVKDGWNYTSLTEDRAFTADAVAQGYMISYNDAAMFYDEQPVSMQIAWRQRLRWSKGHLQAFAETGGPLARNVLIGNRHKGVSAGKKAWYLQLADDFRYRFASFDTLSQLIPFPIIRFALWFFISLICFSCFAFANGMYGMPVFDTKNVLGDVLYHIFGGMYLTIRSGKDAFLLSLFITFFCHVCSVIYNDINNMITAAYVFFIERKRIKNIPLWKKVWYCFTWPVFDMLQRYTMYVAVFVPVTWKPIPHTSKVTIEDIEGKQEGEDNGE